MAAPMEQLIAGCPSCATRFRITRELLDAADGQVRCGACLTVFDGHEHLTRPEQPPPNDADATPPPQARDPIEDATPSPQTHDPIEDATPSPQAHDPIEPEVLEAESPPPSPSASAAARTIIPEAAEAEVAEVAEVEVEAEAEVEASALPTIVAASRARKRKRTPRRRPRRPALVVSWVLIMAVTFIGGAVGFLLDAWSRNPAMHSIHVAACEAIGCTPSPLRSITDIKLIDHGPESRPGPPEALILNAELVNQASFPQPFPIVTIRFMATNGRTVVSHRHNPADYLNVPQPPPMTPNRRVQISLRFDDPGTKAVSYSLSLL